MHPVHLRHGPLARPARRVALAATLLVVVAAMLGPQPALRAEAGTHGRRGPMPPNIVLILTDDQRWDTLRFMPHVRQDLMSNGMTFQNAFVSNSLCCPSRSSILTGNYSHTTGVYTNIAPTGGWHAFHDLGAESSTIPTWLHDAGYHTSLIGKYLNEYGPDNPFIPPGWDHWVAFEKERAYYDYTLNVDGSFVSYGHTAADYSTDVLADYAVRDIEQTPPDEPLFMYLATAAPHGPITPAPRDIGSVLGGKTHWPPSVNERDMGDKPRYMRTLKFIDEKKLSKKYVRMVETLRAVDDAVHDVVGALRSTGRLDDTLIMFASDNGNAFGEHRWMYKLVPYEESIRIPLVVRWDGVVPPGTEDRHLVANIDVAPTFADAAGVVAPPVDGRSLVPLLGGDDVAWRELFLLEHLWFPAKRDATPPTFCGVRSQHRVFVHYASGFEEYYDLSVDPYELSNAIDRPSSGWITRLRNATRRLCEPRPPGMPPF